jgi:hypothetical protein
VSLLDHRFWWRKLFLPAADRPVADPQARDKFLDWIAPIRDLGDGVAFEVFGKFASHILPLLLPRLTSKYS